MGTTPTYSWPYPESSDYVADGATAIENLADAADTTVAGLESELDSIGTWTAWTPSLQFASVGNGTISGAYCQINGLVFVRMAWELGSTSTVSSGFSVEAPIDGDTGEGVRYFGSCIYGDASAGTEYLGSMNVFSSDRLRFYVWTASNNWAVTSNTVPFTWSTSDVVRMSGMYKAT